MKNRLLLFLFMFALATTAIAGETESSANAATAPHNTAMFAVTVNPEPDHLGDGGAFDWSVAVIPTASMPSGHLTVTAILPGGTRLILEDGTVPGGHVEYSYYPLDGPTQGGAYWLASFFYGVPSKSGLSLVNGRLPSGVSVETAFVPDPQYAKDFQSVKLMTASLISDVAQSPDRMTVTFTAPAKTFNPAAPAFVYFTAEPVPVRPEAVTVTSDGSAVILDLHQDPDTARWMSYPYAVAIYQPAANGLPALDQSALLAFKSPLDVTPRTVNHGIRRRVRNTSRAATEGGPNQQ